MPPSTSDGPLNTLEQIRDLLAEVLQERATDKGEGKKDGGDGKGDKDADDDKPRKPRKPDVFDHTVGLLGSLGGAPAELAALLKRMQDVGEKAMDLGSAAKKWWDGPDPRTQRTREGLGQAPQIPEPVTPPIIPGGELKLEPPDTPTIPPPQPAPVTQLAPQSAPMTQVMPPEPIEPPEMPTLPDWGEPPETQLAPVLPTQMDLAPLQPIPLPGLATDADTVLPPGEDDRLGPVSQSAPVLVPNAPGGSSGSATAQDSARLAAVLERLVVLLDKMGAGGQDEGRGGDGDETEQGENWQRKSMWSAAGESSGGEKESAGESLPAPKVPPDKKEEGKDPLTPGGGALGGIGGLLKAAGNIGGLLRMVGS